VVLVVALVFIGLENIPYDTKKRFDPVLQYGALAVIAYVVVGFVVVLPYVMIRDHFREKRGRCSCGAVNYVPPATECWRCHEPLLNRR
jgi:hypothetical protein